MTYRWLITVLPSPESLHFLYASQPHLRKASYEEHRAALLYESFGGTSDAYEINLSQLGQEATTVAPNAVLLQAQWALENGLRSAGQQLIAFQRDALKVGMLSKLRLFTNIQQIRLLNQIFLAQVQKYRPDVLVIALRTTLPAEIIREARKYVRCVIGTLDTPFPGHSDLFNAYDVILTPFPHYVDFFNTCGLRSDYMPLAFEPTFLQRCAQRFGEVPQRQYGAVFVGSVSPSHEERMRLLAALAATRQVDFWVSLDNISPTSVPPALREASHQPVYGLTMYDVLRRAKIALNAHPEISGPYAAVFRIFEITGAGALLLTDARRNQPPLFEPDREIITYGSANECVEKLLYYLEHEEERAAIAQRGQERTYSEHLFIHRSARMIDLVKNLL